ncbi:MAG: hypothetical protein KKH28_06295 [Elusimicrobia bacterium]|nr:hypothetical protein [Elusimicrobiota bacterium]
MTGKNYFILGCKLFGVYCLVLAVPGLLNIVPAIMQINRLGAYGQGIVPMLVLGQIGPLIYLIAGIYLVIRGEAFYRFSYPEGNGGINATEEKVLLYLKMLGIYLVVEYVSDFLKALSGIGYAMVVPVYMGQGIEKQFMLYSNLASSLWGILVGIYLARDGRYVAKLAFKSLAYKS